MAGQAHRPDKQTDMTFLQHLIVFFTTTACVVAAAVAAETLLRDEERAEARTREAIKRAHTPA